MTTASVTFIDQSWILIRWAWRYLFLYASIIAPFLSKFRHTVFHLNRMLQNVHLPLLPGTSFKTNVSYSGYCCYILMNITCTNKVSIFIQLGNLQGLFINQPWYELKNGSHRLFSMYCTTMVCTVDCEKQIFRSNNTTKTVPYFWCLLCSVCLSCFPGSKVARAWS
jgi:hypothetical protein